LPRIGRFFSNIHPKVIVSSLISSLATAFAPMVPSLIQHGAVTVGRGQLGLALLVGFLTFAGGWLKNGPRSPILSTAEELVKQVLAALPPVTATPSLDEIVKTVKHAVLADVTQVAAGLVTQAAVPVVKAEVVAPIAPVAPAPVPTAVEAGPVVVPVVTP
jgi:hypothetical protein